MMKKMVVLFILLLLVDTVMAMPLAISGGTIEAQIGNAQPPDNGGSTGGGGTSSHRQCNDGIDNDNDGHIDLEDLGCDSKFDNMEYSYNEKYDEDVILEVINDMSVDVSGNTHIEKQSLIQLLGELIEEYQKEPTLLDKIIEKIRNYYKGQR